MDIPGSVFEDLFKLLLEHNGYRPKIDYVESNNQEKGLPDFFFPKLNLYVEVKGGETNNALRLTEHQIKVAEDLVKKGYKVLLLKFNLELRDLLSSVSLHVIFPDRKGRLSKKGQLRRTD